MLERTAHYLLEIVFLHSYANGSFSDNSARLLSFLNIHASTAGSTSVSSFLLVPFRHAILLPSFPSSCNMCSKPCTMLNKEVDLQSLFGFNVS
jgi:hypothetical protein